MTMIITVLLVTNVQAEVFRWTDSNGVIHSTDNITGQTGSVQASPREMDASDWLAAIQGSWRRTGSTPAQLELAFKVLDFFEEIPEEHSFPEKLDEILTILNTKVMLQGTAYHTKNGVSKASVYSAKGWLSLDEGPAGTNGEFVFKRGRNPYMEDFTLLLLLNLLNRADFKGTDTIAMLIDGDQLTVNLSLPSAIGVNHFTVRYQRIEK